MNFEIELCEISSDYSEILSCLKLIREATINEVEATINEVEVTINEVEVTSIKDIEKSLNLLIVKMDTINKRLEELSDEIFKFLI